MHEIAETPTNNFESVGPFEIHKIVLDGYRVPRLSGRPTKDGMWSFTLDERFGIDVPEMYAKGVVMMIANAMAIGAGYSCFGENSQEFNPFKTRLFGMDLAAEVIEEVSPAQQ